MTSGRERFGLPAYTPPPTSRAPSRSRSRTRASPASSAWRRAGRSTSRCCSAAGTSSSTSTATRPTSYLARAVEGFFLNGGTTCYVVRVAHRAQARASSAGPEHAACAERVVKDGWDKPTLRVRALNEGRWGNNIWVRFQQTTAARTLLTLDLEVGSGEARVNSDTGFERGALVRIYDRENSDYVVVTEVDDRIIRWGSATPIVRRYRAAGPTYLEVLEFEVFASLQGSPRGVPRPADVAAVAPLRAAHHQRRVAADPARGSAVAVAAAAQPAAGGAGGQARRRARRHRGADGGGLRRPRPRAGRSHGPDGARRRRRRWRCSRCPTS